MSNTGNLGRLFMAMLLSSVGCRSAAIQYESVAANVSFDQVQTLPVREATVRVSYGDAPTQFAELWLPTDQEEKSPVLVLVHGGCWLNSFGIDHTKAMSTALMQSGFAVWNLEYRRLGDEGGGWPGSFEDIQAGIVRLTELDSDVSDHDLLDLSRVILMGHSAGGHLALLAGNALTSNPPEHMTIRAVVGLAAIVDLATYAEGTSGCQEAAAKFMGATPQERPDLYHQANPIDLLLHPNTLLIHGDADRIVPISQAKEAGLEVERVPGAGHFDLIHPGTPAWSHVLRILERISQ